MTAKTKRPKSTGASTDFRTQRFEETLVQIEHARSMLAARPKNAVLGVDKGTVDDMARDPFLARSKP